jgi:hypothetical protein
MKCFSPTQKIIFPLGRFGRINFRWFLEVSFANTTISDCLINYPYIVNDFAYNIAFLQKLLKIDYK